MAFPKTDSILRNVFDEAAKARATELKSKAEIVWGKPGNADDAITNPNNFYFNSSLLDQALDSQGGHEKVMTYLTQIEHGVYP